MLNCKNFRKIFRTYFYKFKKNFGNFAEIRFSCKFKKIHKNFEKHFDEIKNILGKLLRLQEKFMKICNKFQNILERLYKNSKKIC